MSRRSGGRTFAIAVALLGVAAGGCLGGDGPGPPPEPGAALNYSEAAREGGVSPPSGSPPADPSCSDPIAAHIQGHSAYGLLSVTTCEAGNVTVLVQERGRPDTAEYGIEGEDPGRFLLPFLQGNRQYEVEIQLDAGGLNLSHVVSFVTPPERRFWAEPDDSPIRPGAPVTAPNQLTCTMGFITRDPRNDTLYMISAGHCMPEIGSVVRWGNSDDTYADESREFGEVVFTVSKEDAEDFAIVRVYDHYRGRVSPETMYWTGPIGLLIAGDIENRDVMCGFHNAWPQRTGQAATGHRCRRAGPWDYYGDAEYTWSPSWDYPGDSGSPVFHYESGLLVGIMIAATGGVESACSILKLADRAGFPMRVATSPYEPPPADLAPEPLPDNPLHEFRALQCMYGAGVPSPS